MATSEDLAASGDLAEGLSSFSLPEHPRPHHLPVPPELGPERVEETVLSSLSAGGLAVYNEDDVAMERGFHIFSLSELGIGRRYCTTDGVNLFRVSSSHVVLEGKGSAQTVKIPLDATQPPLRLSTEFSRDFSHHIDPFGYDDELQGGDDVLMGCAKDAFEKAAGASLEAGVAVQSVNGKRGRVIFSLEDLPLNATYTSVEGEATVCRLPSGMTVVGDHVYNSPIGTSIPTDLGAQEQHAHGDLGAGVCALGL